MSFCEHHVWVPAGEEATGKSSYCQSCSDGTLHCSLFVAKYLATPDGKRAACPTCKGLHYRKSESGLFCEDCGHEENS